MSVVLDERALKQAYEGSPELEGAIRNAAAAGPGYVELFNYISVHINNIKASARQSSNPDSEPAAKKRKLEEPNGLASRPASNGTNGHGVASAEDEVLLEVMDISMVMPQRKKYTLCFTQTHLYARRPESKEPVAGTSFAFADIEHAFLLPVPDKAQKQYNILLFPRNSSLPPSKPTPGAPPPPDPLVFTIPDAAPKPNTISGSLAADAAAVSDDFKTLMRWAITERWRRATGRKDQIVEGDAKLFASAQRQAHRPNEKATWVKAFRGSKDGYLFFLPVGILWAFKKPLLFLSFARIAGVSYVSVLQRTFNLQVEVQHLSEEDAPAAASSEPGSVAPEEIEFAMLDQEDFAGIDAFVKRHGLQDRSLAASRKAKRENVNVVKDEQGNVVGSVEAGELERAEREGGGEGEMLDEEDEDSEGEDYDPGSEGESEGSGTSSEGEDDEEDGGGGGAGDEDDEDEEGEEDADADEL